MLTTEKPQENGINQHFIKQNGLTKQLKGRIQRSEMLHKKYVLFGCHLKCCQPCALTVFSFFFVTSFIGVIIMWGTSTFDNFVLSRLILINNTQAFTLWKAPPVKALVKIHIFNYTNVDEYENGIARKLHVEDIGPFVYEETTQKTNIKFHSNSSISYQEFHSHVFRTDLSRNRKETDRVVVPNLAVLGAAAVVNTNSYFVTRMAVSTIMRGLRAYPFLNLAANQFLWGYDDSLFELAKTLFIFSERLPYEKFGILVTRNGTSKDIITINSGVNDLSNIAQIERINGQEYVNHWGTQDCNRIKGSDGGAYPVYEVRKKKPVNMYFREICRRFPLVYKKDVRIMDDRVAAYRYSVADTIFERPEVEPENECYCDSGACAPQGIFNISKCTYGAPISISFPHFFKADPELQKGVTGLSPNQEMHSSYLDLHPVLGFPMGGTYRLQVNIQVKKSLGVSQVDMFEDNMYLPVAWIEAGVNASDLSEDMTNAILLSSVTLPAFEKALKYGFLLLAVLSFIVLAFILTHKFYRRFQLVNGFT